MVTNHLYADGMVAFLVDIIGFVLMRGSNPNACSIHASDYSRELFYSAEAILDSTNICFIREMNEIIDSANQRMSNSVNKETSCWLGNLQ